MPCINPCWASVVGTPIQDQACISKGRSSRDLLASGISRLGHYGIVKYYIPYSTCGCLISLPLLSKHGNNVGLHRSPRLYVIYLAGLQNNLSDVSANHHSLSSHCHNQIGTSVQRQCITALLLPTGYAISYLPARLESIALGLESVIALIRPLISDCQMAG